MTDQEPSLKFQPTHLLAKDYCFPLIIRDNRAVVHYLLQLYTVIYIVPFYSVFFASKFL